MSDVEAYLKSLPVTVTAEAAVRKEIEKIDALAAMVRNGGWKEMHVHGLVEGQTERAPTAIDVRNWPRPEVLASALEEWRKAKRYRDGRRSAISQDLKAGLKPPTD